MSGGNYYISYKQLLIGTNEGQMSGGNYYISYKQLLIGTNEWGKLLYLI